MTPNWIKWIEKVDEWMDGQYGICIQIWNVQDTGTKKKRGWQTFQDTVFFTNMHS